MSRNDGNNPFFDLLGMLLIPAIVFSIVMSVDSPNAKMEKQVNQTYEISSIADEIRENNFRRIHNQTRFRYRS